MEAVHHPTDNKFITYRISHLTVNVPYRKPGNVIEHLPVNFSIHQYGAGYRAIPLCNAEVQRLTGLPNVIYFDIKNGKPVLKQTAVKEVAEQIVRILQSEASLS